MASTGADWVDLTLDAVGNMGTPDMERVDGRLTFVYVDSMQKPSRRSFPLALSKSPISP